MDLSDATKTEIIGWALSAGSFAGILWGNLVRKPCIPRSANNLLGILLFAGIVLIGLESDKQQMIKDFVHAIISRLGA